MVYLGVDKIICRPHLYTVAHDETYSNNTSITPINYLCKCARKLY